MHKYFKRIVMTVLLLGIIFGVSAHATLASLEGETVTTGATNVTSQSQNTTKTFRLTNPLSSKINSVSDLVKNFVDIISYLAVIVAVILLIWVGLQFILARGDAGKMKDLKEWLFWIVVGVAVVIGARVIVDVVINTLASSGVDPNTINTVRGAL